MLKDQQNESGQPYYIQPQVPEPKATQRREMRQKIAEIKKTNATITDPAKHTKAEIRNGSLYINGKQNKQHIYPPTVVEMFNIDKTAQSRMDKVSLEASNTIIEKSSEFTAFAVRATTAPEVKLAYKKVKQLVPEADHVIMAYTFKQHIGYHDCGEHGAGKKLMQILSNRSAKNIAVFVSRVFGGIPLGPKRFMMIEKVAREALDLLQATPK